MNNRAKELMDKETKPKKRFIFKVPKINRTHVILSLLMIILVLTFYLTSYNVKINNLTDKVYDNEEKMEAYVDLLVEDDKAIRERVGTLEDNYDELDEDVEDLRFDVASQDLQVVIEDMEWEREQRDICQEEEENQDDCDLRLNEVACNCGSDAYAYSWRDNDEYVSVCFKSKCELNEGDY